jgi:hypothetical protein
MRRFPWEIIIGLIIGAALGLTYAWIISPMRYIDTVPSSLRADFKDQYHIAISAAYAATGDIQRARARLALLGDGDSVQALSAQAQRMLANGEDIEIVNRIARLASDLQGKNIVQPVITQTILTPQPNVTLTPSPNVTENPPGTEQPVVETEQPQGPLSTATPRPTQTPTATAGAPFNILSQETVCKPNLTEALLQVYVIDTRKRELPGVELVVTWDGGEDHFFTGFKPEIGDGYADFQMQPGISYTLRVGSGGAPATDLIVPSCPSANGDNFNGGLSITFQRP